MNRMIRIMIMRRSRPKRRMIRKIRRRQIAGMKTIIINRRIRR
jgi:hypothetical protein